MLMQINSNNRLPNPSLDAFVLQLGPDPLQVVRIRVSETGNKEEKS